MGTHSGELAIYTGRAIYLKVLFGKENLPKFLKVTKGKKQNFRLNVSPDIWGKANKFILNSENEENNSLDLNFLTLAHEYCHWLMTKNTTLATFVEAVSWRATLEQVVLCDLIQKTTGIPENLNKQNMMKLNERQFRFQIQKKLERIAKEPQIRKLFNDFVTHHYFAAFYYPTILSTFLEPITWTLIPEHKKTGYELLDTYFKGTGSPYKYARDTLEVAETYLE